MPKKFQLVKRVLGYIRKADKTNISPEFLVYPSQNVVINDEELIETRGGYSIHGAVGSGTDPIESAYDWQTSSNSVINLRAYDEYLQFYAGTIGGVEFNAWINLEDGFSAVDFSFTTWWDTTLAIDLLLFVNGGDNIWDWSGGLASVKSVTANTITKNGDTTWAQERFLTAGTRSVIIGGNKYTYTDGEDTTILKGVSPTPADEDVDSLVFQAIRNNGDEPADGAKNDMIAVLDNQVYIGSNTSKEVSVSKNTDFKDFTFSSSRIPGEGALLVLDSIIRGFARLGKFMLISSGRSDWYRTNFHQLDIGGTLTETLEVKKLKSGVGWAAQSQDLIAEIGDTIAFISFEPALRIVETIEQLDNPQMKNISDPIKTDFDAETFTGGHIKFYKNGIYICCPATDRVYINEVRQAIDEKTGKEYLRRFWQPPQILPVSKFAIIDDLLYGHSSGINETYKLFDGADDNNKSFAAKAWFSYRNFGKRDLLKSFDEIYIEGYISSNAEITMKINYDYGGYTQKLESSIKGDDDDIIFEASEGGGLGDSPLGDAPLGDQEDESNVLPKFRVIKTFVREDFFEIQFGFETDAQDYQFKILAHGPNALLSKAQPTNIKQ